MYLYLVLGIRRRSVIGYDWLRMNVPVVLKCLVLQYQSTATRIVTTGIVASLMVDVISFTTILPTFMPPRTSRKMAEAFDDRHADDPDDEDEEDEEADGDEDQEDAEEEEQDDDEGDEQDDDDEEQDEEQGEEANAPGLKYLMGDIKDDAEDEAHDFEPDDDDDEDEDEIGDGDDDDDDDEDDDDGEDFEHAEDDDEDDDGDDDEPTAKKQKI